MITYLVLKLDPKYGGKTILLQKIKVWLYKTFFLYPQYSLDTLYRYCRLERYQNQFLAVIYLPSGIDVYHFLG